MRYATSHPWVWFGLGGFASFSAGMLVEAARTERPGRWNSEVGLLIGGFLVALEMTMAAGLFAGWLAWRRRGQPNLRPHFALALVPGLLLSWLMIGSLVGSFALIGPREAMNWVVPIVFLGSPLVLAEALIRLMRPRGKLGLSADRGGV